MAALKRMLREVFAELVTAKERLAQLESKAGISAPSSIEDMEASRLGASAVHDGSSAGDGASWRRSKHRTALSGV